MNSRIDTLRELEEELNIRLRGPLRPPQESVAGTTYWEFRGGRGGMAKRMRQLGRRGASGQGGAGDPRQQRVVIKASYSVHKTGKSHGVLRAHVKYLGRDSTSLDGDRGRFYDAREQDVDAAARVQAWEGDRHHFRFIVSPEYGDRIDRQPGGLTGYVRELMAQVEKDLNAGGASGGKLEWTAINHHNTDDLHAHVLVRGKVLRGREDGKDLVIPRDYIRYGMKRTAQAIATRRLGERSADQVCEQLRKEVRAERYTALDAAIERSVDGDRRLRLTARDALADDALRRRVAGRLAHLEGMGLASRDRHGRWTVDGELKPMLRELAERNDIIKNLYGRFGARSASVATYRGESELVGYVAGTGTHDELRGQRYLLVRDETARVHYVRVANPEALAALEEGGLARVLPGDPHRTRTDERIAEVARANDGMYTTAVHRRILPEHFAAGDVDGFLRSHERRLQTLEQNGAAARVPGGWAIRDTAVLARGEQARNPRGTGTVEIVSARSIESQVGAKAWTWLDRQTHRQSKGKPSAVAFDRALADAAEARRQWMIARGHAEMSGERYTLRPGIAEALRRREHRTVEREQQQRFGKPARILSAGAEAAGAYRGVVALHDGPHAVLADLRSVALAPVKRVPPLEYGTPVEAKVNARGQAILSGQDKLRDRGAERG